MHAPSGRWGAGARFGPYLGARLVGPRIGSPPQFMRRGRGRGGGSMVLAGKRARTQTDVEDEQSKDGLTLISWNLEGCADDGRKERTEVH